MSVMKKFTAALLACIMLSSVFSCGGPNGPVGDTAGTASDGGETFESAAATESLPPVPEENFVLLESDKIYDEEIEEISIQSMPEKTVYYAGESVDLNGLILRITYKNGKKGTKRGDFSYAPLVVTGAGVQNVEITYKGHVVPFEIDVREGSRDYIMSSVGATIIAKIAENTNGAHPRFIFTDEKIGRLKEMRGSGDLGKKLYNKIQATANNAVSSPLGRFYLSDGLRQGACWNIYERILALGTAYYMTGKSKYADRAIEELINVAEWGDWNAFKHYLDVGCTVGFMGLGYDWFYNEMTEEQRAKIRKAIVELAFDPAIKYDFTNSIFKKGYNWFNDTPGDNWKFICGGGLAIAAMAMCDSPDVSGKCETVLQNVYAELYRFIRNIYDEKDGSYMEGISYWSFGLSYFSVFASCMETAA